MTGELDWLPGGANSDSERRANADEARASAGRVGVLLCLVQDPQRARTGATGAGFWEAVVLVGLPAPDTPGEYRDTPVYHLLAEVHTREAVVGCRMITQLAHRCGRLHLRAQL